MGEKYEVNSWVYILGTHENHTHYEYQQRYYGSSLCKALYVMYQEKRKGVGCVKLNWR